MRFPRNARIFRGQIDIAALASVFFILILFLVATSLFYIPGVPLEVGARTNPQRKEVVITKQGKIQFQGASYDLGSTDDLRTKFQQAGLFTVVVRAESGAPRALILLVKEIARDLKLEFETQNVPLSLPESGQALGAASASLVVVINLGGQLFFENELVTPEGLLTKLRNALKTYKTPPTLVIMADKSTENSVLLKVAEVANEAGIRNILMAARPRVFDRPRRTTP